MRVPPSEIETRLRQFRAALRRERIGGFYATRREDVHYLSGFTGADSALLITARQQWLLTDARYTEEAAQSAPRFETLTWKKSLARFAGELAVKNRVKTLGFTSSHLTVALHQELRKGARGAKTIAADALVRDQRQIKSPWEIRRIGKALRCAEAAFAAVRRHLQAGMTEAEVRLELEWEMRRRGAADAAFETIVAAGANASRPHAHAGQRRLQKGGLVLIDFGCRLGGYHSDLTRVLFLGSIPRPWREHYEAVLAAQKAGIKAVGPGVRCRDADKAAREVLKEAGCGDRFTHSLGHGLGLQVHEPPGLNRRSGVLLQPGMVVTVEPGVYYPKRGGIRLEDDVLVTETGRRTLSRLPKDLDWAVI